MASASRPASSAATSRRCDDASCGRASGTSPSLAWASCRVRSSPGRSGRVGATTRLARGRFSAGSPTATSSRRRGSVEQRAVRKSTEGVPWLAPRVKVAKSGYYLRSLVTLAGLAQGGTLTARLLRPAGTLVLRDGLRIRIRSRIDLLVLVETLAGDAYGLRELEERARTIVDVGAGIGDFTVVAARAFPRARVVAFEPDPCAFALLVANVETTARGTSTRARRPWGRQRPTDSSMTRLLRPSRRRAPATQAPSPASAWTTPSRARASTC